ncbi:hypothetical protein [Alkalicoccobacillus plakortidis]|uniref:Lipoprotein n=1 Tax=Alkalicoccobacillus plakortidis TaxID=444060 RepID=A0ABT0XGC5_9BACI|nr:hypothetical protein [Alkalicoccobacillus plakortidis]MCM2674961.1 hypothetical protein [Alkalicoccobacillus plakortidis]
MKKCLIGTLVLSIGFFLTACGNDEEHTNTELSDVISSNTTKTTSDERNTEESQNENEDIEERIQEDENELLNVDLKDRSSMSEEEWVAAYEAKEKLIDFEIEEVAYAWNEIETGGLGKYSYYALVTNTGKVTIDIFPHTVSFYNKDGSVAAVSEGALSVSPNTLNAGEKSLIRMYTSDHDADVDNFDYAELNLGILLSHYDSTKLNIESPTYNTDPTLKATAYIVNGTDIDAVAITSAFVFYNDNGDLIGGLTAGLENKLQAWI